MKMLCILSLLCYASTLAQSNEEACEVIEDGTKLCRQIIKDGKHKYKRAENEVIKNNEEVEPILMHGDNPFPFPIPLPERLARRDGFEVGHTEEVEVGKGRTVKVITRSLKPLLFEIPDFLTDEECDHIIQRAQDPNEGGMFNSKAKGGLTPKSVYQRKNKKGNAGGFYSDFKEWDLNKNGVIEIPEVISIIHKRRVLTFNETDIREMFEAIEEGELLEDDILTKEEFSNLNSIGIEDYVYTTWSENPRFKERWSEQAWLHMEQWIDPTVHTIRERLVKLSGLPRSIIYGGEQLQVVHYEPGGHYHAHHDSETHMRSEIPCCHQYGGDVIESVGECKLCRYVTFVMYLNDVEEGGETAFPVAGEDGYDPEQIRSHGNVSSDKYNLSHGCKRANLVVKPKKRQAVLWYNHYRNETDGWLGEIDLYSLHGGCDVIKGEKWIANMWIPAPYGKGKYKLSNYLIPKDYIMAEAPADYEEDLKGMREDYAKGDDMLEDYFKKNI